MRSITQYHEYIYKAKASAMRAAKNAVGHRFLVAAPELGNRFEGHITIDESMIAVEAHEGGWRWLYTFNLGDVIVEVLDGDGPVIQTLFGEVCHRPDCSTPAASILQGIGIMIARYIARVVQVRANTFHDTPERIVFKLERVDAIYLPAIKYACDVHGFILNEWLERYEKCREAVRQAEAGQYTVNADTTEQWLWMAKNLGMDVSAARERLAIIEAEGVESPVSQPAPAPAHECGERFTSYTAQYLARGPHEHAYQKVE